MGEDEEGSGWGGWMGESEGMRVGASGVTVGQGGGARAEK